MDPSALLIAGAGRLSAAERFHIRFVERSLEPGRLDRSIRWCQRYLGSTWIHLCTRRILRVHGTEQLPPFDPDKSYVLAANHRSFFDLYVITTYLVRSGLPHRILFPVRSEFFYDRWLGLLVNGAMSFFAMYPPIFRQRAKLTLNVTSLDTLATRLSGGGLFAGVHPEGKRGRGADPYTLLPAQRGVGRLLHRAGVTVIPAFINGLGNDIRRQAWGGLVGTAPPIHVVFGAPVPLDDLYASPSAAGVDREIAQRVLDAVTSLGRTERALRAGPSDPPSSA